MITTAINTNITPINANTKMLYSIPFGFVDGLVDGVEGLAGRLEVEAVVGLIKFVVNLCDENLVVGNS